jgi:hypothetical protein
MFSDGGEWGIVAGAVGEGRGGRGRGGSGGGGGGGVWRERRGVAGAGRVGRGPVWGWSALTTAHAAHDAAHSAC